MAGEVARVMDEQLQVRTAEEPDRHQVRPKSYASYTALTPTDDAAVHGGRCRGSVSSRDEEERSSAGAAEGRSGEEERPPQLHHLHAAGAVGSRHHQQDQV